MEWDCFVSSAIYVARHGQRKVRRVSENVVNTLLNLGALGPVLVACGLYIRYLHKELKASHDARVADAQRVIDVFLELNDKWNTTLNELTSTMTGLQTLLELIREQLQRDRT